MTVPWTVELWVVRKVNLTVVQMAASMAAKKVVHSAVLKVEPMADQKVDK